MKDSAFLTVAFMAGGGSVLVGLALAALLLWWFGGSGATQPSERPRTQTAERRITEINEQAREAIIRALLGSRGVPLYDPGSAESRRASRRRPVDGEWQ